MWTTRHGDILKSYVYKLQLQGINIIYIFPIILNSLLTFQFFMEFYLN